MYRRLILLILLFVCSISLAQQSYWEKELWWSKSKTQTVNLLAPFTVSDTNKPLTSYDTSWAYFDGVSSLARTPYLYPGFKLTALDSFDISIDFKLEIPSLFVSGTSRILWGNADNSVYGCYLTLSPSGIIIFNYRRVTEGTIVTELHIDTIDVNTDDSWHTIRLKYNVLPDSILYCYSDGVLKATYSQIRKWLPASLALFAVGHGLNVTNAYPCVPAANWKWNWRGWLRNLEAHLYNGDVDSLHVYKMNEGCGQNFYDSVQYSEYDRSYLAGSRHLVIGQHRGCADSLDITWTNDTRKQATLLSVAGNDSINGVSQAYYNGTIFIADYQECFTLGSAKWYDTANTKTWCVIVGMFTHINVPYQGLPSSYSKMTTRSFGAAMFDSLGVWMPMGAGVDSTNPVGQSFNCATNYGYSVVVGGIADSVCNTDGKVVANNIAIWNGTWSSMNLGVNTEVRALKYIPDKDILVAGGLLDRKSVV